MEHTSRTSPTFSWNLWGKNKEPVSTFFPEVISIIRSIDPDSGLVLHKTIRLSLSFGDGTRAKALVPLSKLDCTDWPELDSRCILNSDYRGAKAYIANVIRAELYNVPSETEYRLRRTGIYQINGSIFFSAGNRVISKSSAAATRPAFDFQHQTVHLDIDENLTAEEALAGMQQLISLSPEIGRVLVAHAIAGITRAAFKQVGLTPCAVLVIVGKSGMLKSHYVPHLVQLYDRASGIGPVTRFNSTNRFIEDVLNEYSECTAVIDDLHTAESKRIKRQNENTFEEIIRRIADDTGRGRMDGHTQVQKQFHGNVVFIGEYTVGKASTIPRALVVNLTKAPNGAILDDYQRHKPLLVSTFYFYFLQWYVDHFDEICDGIDSKLTEFRQSATRTNVHGRLRDTQFYLQLSFLLLLQFLKESGCCPTLNPQDEYSDFCCYLAELIRAQQAQFEQDSGTESVDYLCLIRTLFRQGYFSIAGEAKHFNSANYDGLIYYNCLCLRGECLDRELRCRIPHYSRENCINSLLNTGALRQGGSKNSVQINGTRGKRFYAIYLNRLG